MIIVNGTVITKDAVLEGKAVLFENGKIKNIMDEKDVDILSGEVIDAQKGYILPGFIDIHTHGGVGSDFMDATLQDFDAIVKFQSSHGVTALVATTLTSPMDKILHSLDLIREFMKNDSKGSRILGANLEGPFLSIQNKGAHSEKYILEAQLDKYEELLSYGDIIKIATVAPEISGAHDMIEAFHKLGIVVSGGHDASTEKDIMKAIEKGLSHTTHAFCAMSTISKKQGIKSLGLSEMLLLKDELTTELIADNRHTPPSLVKLIYKCKGPEKICIVSDALRVAGIPPSEKLYKIGPKDMEDAQVVVVEKDVAMLPDKSIFAGSITTVDKMIKNLVCDCDIPLVQAVRMASMTPAEIIKVDKEKGSIEIGKDADLCIMDKNFQVQKTWVEGKLVFTM